MAGPTTLSAARGNSEEIEVRRAELVDRLYDAASDLAAAGKQVAELTWSSPGQILGRTSGSRDLGMVAELLHQARITVRSMTAILETSSY